MQLDAAEAGEYDRCGLMHTSCFALALLLPLLNQQGIMSAQSTSRHAAVICNAMRCITEELCSGLQQ